MNWKHPESQSRLRDKWIARWGDNWSGDIQRAGHHHLDRAGHLFKKELRTPTVNCLGKKPCSRSKSCIKHHKTQCSFLPDKPPINIHKTQFSRGKSSMASRVLRVGAIEGQLAVQHEVPWWAAEDPAAHLKISTILRCSSLQLVVVLGRFDPQLCTCNINFCMQIAT